MKYVKTAERPYVHPDGTLISDEEILLKLGYSPTEYRVEHCAHCDRMAGRHPSCIVVRK